MSSRKRLLWAEPQRSTPLAQPATANTHRQAADAHPRAPQGVLQLQRTLGNRAVGRLLGQAPVVQRRVNGPSPDAWVKEKGVKQHLAARLLEFARLVEGDDLIYEASELDSFYNAELAGRSHAELEDTAAVYDAFRRYVARIRDAEGAHGHERHAGTGDQFIVDRVNQADKDDFTASYLLMDDYLIWDSVLKAGAADIFKAYLASARDTVRNFGQYARGKLLDEQKTPGPLQPITKQQAKAVMPEKESFMRPRLIRVTFANQKWELTLTTYLKKGAAISEGPDGLKLKVHASIKGSRQLKSRSVSKTAGIAAHVRDVVAQNKQPEAHTGGLAPEFTMDRDLDPVATPEAAELNWVTKF